jgi:hypothetical protein
LRFAIADFQQTGWSRTNKQSAITNRQSKMKKTRLLAQAGSFGFPNPEECPVR